MTRQCIENGTARSHMHMCEDRNTCGDDGLDIGDAYLRVKLWRCILWGWGSVRNLLRFGWWRGRWDWIWCRCFRGLRCDRHRWRLRGTDAWRRTIRATMCRHLKRLSKYMSWIGETGGAGVECGQPWYGMWRMWYLVGLVPIGLHLTGRYLLCEPQWPNPRDAKDLHKRSRWADEVKPREPGTLISWRLATNCRAIMKFEPHSSGHARCAIGIGLSQASMRGRSDIWKDGCGRDDKTGSVPTKVTGASSDLWWARGMSHAAVQNGHWKRRANWIKKSKSKNKNKPKSG